MQGDLFIEEFDGSNNTPVDVSTVDINFGDKNRQREMMNRAVENLRTLPAGRHMLFPTGSIHKLPHYKDRNDFPYLVDMWRGKVIPPNLGSMRYPMISVGGFNMLFHRLIAMVLIPNPLPADKPIVHHYNNDPHDYAISNLAWASHSENMTHAWSVKTEQTKYYGASYV